MSKLQCTWPFRHPQRCTCSGLWASESKSVGLALEALGTRNGLTPTTRIAKGLLGIHPAQQENKRALTEGGIQNQLVICVFGKCLPFVSGAQGSGPGVSGAAISARVQPKNNITFLQYPHLEQKPGTATNTYPRYSGKAKCSAASPSCQPN